MENKNGKTEIDLIDLFNILWNKIFFISSLVCISAILSILYATSQVNIYKSDAFLEVVGTENTNSLGGLGAYATMAGVDMGSSSNRSALILETIKSRDFFERVIVKPNLMYGLMAAKDFDRLSGEMIFNTNIYDFDSKEWMPGKKPSMQQAFRSFENKMFVSLDKNTGFIRISFEHVSPKFAQEIILNIINEVNIFFKNKDYNDSSKAISFLSNKLASSQILEIRQSISQLIPKQIEAQMKSEMKEDYVLSFIEEPNIPENKFKPNKPLICILGTISGFLLAIFIVLVRYYLSERNTLQ